MKTSLLKTLVEKKIGRVETEVEARVRVPDIGGQLYTEVVGSFLIRGVRFDEANDCYVLRGYSTRDGAMFTIDSRAIRLIDGMEPDRFASVYNISPEGETKRTGKRRGRKPRDPSKMSA